MSKCFASISDTDESCAWCVTNTIVVDGIEMFQAFCEKHNKPCGELNYYCRSFIGYKPNYRLSDEEVREIVESLRKEGREE